MYQYMHAWLGLVVCVPGWSLCRPCGGPRAPRNHPHLPILTGVAADGKLTVGIHVTSLEMEAEPAGAVKRLPKGMPADGCPWECQPVLQWGLRMS